jgi:glycosyltransferase involved in cell wall biosynthesis
MKLAFICAGDIQVPPPSWGAVEILVWEYFNNLKELGVDVRIYNSKDLNWVLSEINKENFDFIHLQHEDYLPHLKFIKDNFAVTAHCGWAENFKYYEPYYWKTFKSIIKTNGYIFALSEQIKNNYINFGVDSSKIFITKNGVNTDRYRKTLNPSNKDRSIYLGKIENRKRQHILSDKDMNVDFAGFGNELKLSTSNKLLGTWSKEDVYAKMTDYANLILLSISEAHPLVCMEGLSAGLGLVISEKSTANLDLTKKFISVIPENKINDFDFIKKTIEENRKYSINNREEIFQYSKNFDWKNISKNYLNLVESLVNK